jgi:hypothetical protein
MVARTMQDSKRASLSWDQESVTGYRTASEAVLYPEAGLCWRAGDACFVFKRLFYTSALFLNVYCF